MSRPALVSEEAFRWPEQPLAKGGMAVVYEGEDRRLTRKVILKGRASKETPVKEIMTEPVLTVGPSAGVAECMRMMTERRVRHLPVLDQNKLVGILSIGDLLKWTISAQGVAIDNLERFITGNEPT